MMHRLCSRAPSRLWRAAAAGMLAVAVVVLAACQAQVRVSIDAASDGSGTVAVTVTLDQQAAQAHPDLAQQLRVEDLRQAGWTVVGPSPVNGGGTQIVATKPFRTPSQADATFKDISGPTGPLRDFHLSVHKGLLSSSSSFHGTADLRCGLDCFADPQLQQQLGGAALGIDPARLRQDGIDPNQLATVEVAVKLPGGLHTTDAPSRIGGVARWDLKLGDDASLAAAASHSRTGVVVEVGVVVLALVAVLVALAWWRRRRGRRDHVFAQGRRREAQIRRHQEQHRPPARDRPPHGDRPQHGDPSE